MKLVFFFLFSVTVFSAYAQRPALKQPRTAPEIKEELGFAGYKDFFSVSEVKGRIAPAKAIYLPKPVFSDELRDAGLDGKVRVDIVIATDGTVSSVNAVSGFPELYPAAETAARNSRFLPSPNEIDAYLVYEFVIRSPDWFLVAYDLYAVRISNPGVIRKAFPEDWTEERELAAKLIELRRSQPRRPELVPGLKTTDNNRSQVSAAVQLPVSPFEMNSVASKLREMVRTRLAADPNGLRRFELGEAFIMAMSVRNPDMRAISNGILRPFVERSPANLPPAWVERLRSFLADERKLVPGAYTDRLRTMALEFRLLDGR